MKIALLGGTRFVGPIIVHSLVREGHDVQVYHRGKTVCNLPEGVQHVTIDRNIRGQTQAALKQNSPDAVIDMTGFRPEQVEEVIAADSDLEHYVFCSTAAVYGQIGKSTPDEASRPEPRSAYELGKIGCEELLLEAQAKRGIPVTILRLAHPYGPGDELLYITGRKSLFLDRMRHGRPIVIPGKGDTRIHPIYVKDAGEAFVYVLGRSDCTGGIFNLAGEEVLSLDEYFASISRALGKPLVAEHIPVDWLEANSHLWAGQKRTFNFAITWCRHESAFCVTALQATGFRCRTNHDQGVAETIEWLDKRGLIPRSSDGDLEDLLLKLAREEGVV